MSKTRGCKGEGYTSKGSAATPQVSCMQAMGYQVSGQQVLPPAVSESQMQTEPTHIPAQATRNLPSPIPH